MSLGQLSGFHATPQSPNQQRRSASTQGALKQPPILQIIPTNVTAKPGEKRSEPQRVRVLVFGDRAVSQDTC